MQESTTTPIHPETDPLKDVRPKLQQRIGIRPSQQAGQQNTASTPNVPVLPPLETIQLKAEELPTSLETSVPSSPIESPGLAPTRLGDCEKPLPEQSQPEVASQSQNSPTASEPSPRDLTWAQYTAWRRSKTPPEYVRMPLDIALDECDNALHEAHGEWAELNETVLQYNTAVVTEEEARQEMIGEAGDCLFTINWLLDSLGAPIGEANRKISDLFTGIQDLEHFRSSRGLLAGVPIAAMKRPTIASVSDQNVMGRWTMDTMNVLLAGHRQLGLVSNFFKKLRWQRRQMDQATAVKDAFGALNALECLCVLLGTSTIDIALYNVNKLNTRFPNGWEPGGGKR